MDIAPGIYAHYKGGKYRVLFVAKDSTNSRIRNGAKNDVVVYVSLTNGSLWCRDLSEFTGIAAWPDGTMRPRFVPEEA